MGKVFYDDSDGRLGVEETRRGGSQMGRDRRESVGSAARQRLPRREMDSLNNLLPDAVVCYFLLFRASSSVPLSYSPPLSYRALTLDVLNPLPCHPLASTFAICIRNAMKTQSGVLDVNKIHYVFFMR